jgi:ABC-type transporter Mla subunit MlaD
MSDDLFRIIVTTGVIVAAIAFVIQAIAGIAALRAARAVQGRVDSLAGRAEPLLEKAGPVIEQIGPTLQQIGPTLHKAGLVLDKAVPAIEKVGPVADRLSALIASGQHIVDDTRPRVAEFSGEAVAIAREARQQVGRLGDLLTDAGDRARMRLEQIDQAVDTTVGKVEQVGQNVKRTVTRPVREVNSMAAAISAAVSTLVKGRRSSINTATQDEEMFI